MISSTTANLIGFVGMGCIIFAYAYITGKDAPNPFIQHGVNLAGAALLTVSLLVNMNAPSLVLEGFWAAIAIWGLVKAFRGRARRGRMIVAVDGPTASGKGTIARALAAHFGLPHLDTGLLYRAVGRQCFLDGGNPDNPADALAATSFPNALLSDPELRAETTGGLASRVSVHPAVREALYERQRSFALQPGGAVLDGRDIGTVIAPEAEVKLFVVAGVETRALRRFREMEAQGRPCDLAALTADLRARDERDASRPDAPLRAAPDAAVIDTSELSIGEAVERAIDLVEQVRRRA